MDTVNEKDGYVAVKTEEDSHKRVCKDLLEKTIIVSKLLNNYAKDPVSVLDFLTRHVE